MCVSRKPIRNAGTALRLIDETLHTIWGLLCHRTVSSTVSSACSNHSRDAVYHEKLKHWWKSRVTKWCKKSRRTLWENMKNWDGSSWIYDFFYSIKHQKHISRNAWVNFSAFYNIRVFDVCSSLKQILKLLISTIQQWCEINTLSYTSTTHSYKAVCWRFDVQPSPHPQCFKEFRRHIEEERKWRKFSNSKKKWALASLWNTNIKLMEKLWTWKIVIEECYPLSHSKCCSIWDILMSRGF